MKTFYIDYYDKTGDLCHVWVEARDKEDDEEEARHEWWDIEEIISIRESKR